MCYPNMAEPSIEFGPRKTIIILAIVAGCFAALWPKIFYPMLKTSISPQNAPHSSGCCDVIFESDITAADIMQELCHNIIKHMHVDLKVKDALDVNIFKKRTASNTRLCRDEVLAKCAIDLSSFLDEKEQLKKSYKQVLEEIRRSNQSLCLKKKFGLPLSRLWTSHLNKYHILMPHTNLKQERQIPPHAGSYHPALRERGRAIPTSHIVPRIQDRSDYVAPMKMRPPMGGTGHVVTSPKGNGSLGFLMPLYTIGIVIFFLYTISKILRKSADNEIIRSEYSTASAEREYQKLVFNPNLFAAAVTAVNDTAHDQEKKYKSELTDSYSIIDDLQNDQAHKSIGLAAGVKPNLKQEHSSVEKTYSEDEKELHSCFEVQPTIKVVNMEMTTSCEGGVKCSKLSTPIITGQSRAEQKETPSISIYLEGALPAQCDLLVTDSKTQEVQEEENVEIPVVLSSKMTLSLINLDQVAAENIENNQLKIRTMFEVESNDGQNLFSKNNKGKSEISNDNFRNNFGIIKKKLKKHDTTGNIYKSNIEKDCAKTDMKEDNNYKKAVLDIGNNNENDNDPDDNIYSVQSNTDNNEMIDITTERDKSDKLKRKEKNFYKRQKNHNDYEIKCKNETEVECKIGYEEDNIKNVDKKKKKKSRQK